MHPRLEKFLGEKQARFQLVPAHASTSHVAAWARARVAIVKERDGLAMAVVPATCIVDFTRLARVIGRGAVRAASAREIEETVSDCATDVIPPFGALFGLPTLVDQRLLSAREITMSAGDARTLLRMRAGEYRRLAAPRVGDFALPESLLAIATMRVPRRRAG
jgi:Ala-tRNA(Pro) deacylase